MGEGSFSDLAKLLHNLVGNVHEYIFEGTRKIFLGILFRSRGSKHRLPQEVASVHVLNGI